MGRPERYVHEDNMEQRGAELASFVRGPGQSRLVAADLVRRRLSPGVSNALMKRLPRVFEIGVERCILP